jgi:hypothetical protein
MTSAISFLLFSCSSVSQKNILGQYKYTSKISLGKLILFDSIFEYEYEAPLNSYKSRGNWSSDGNLLVLKSFDSFNNNYMIIEEKNQENNGYIQILDKYNLPIQNINIVINNENLIFKTDINGKIDIKLLNGVPVKSIKVESIDLSNNHNIYFSTKENSNVFLIKIIPIDYEKKFFNYERFVIKNNKVIINNQIYIKY